MNLAGLNDTIGEFDLPFADRQLEGRGLGREFAGCE